jgi:hypothetical protein
VATSEPAASRFAGRLAAIFVFALALRLGIRLVTGVEDYWTEGATFYANIAWDLAAGKGYAGASR